MSNKQCIHHFISDVPFLVDLITEIDDAMKETSPVFSGFYLFNPEYLDKSKQDRKDLSQTLINHYDHVKSDSFEGRKIRAVHVINPIYAASKVEDFMEAIEREKTNGSCCLQIPGGRWLLKAVYKCGDIV